MSRASIGAAPALLVLGCSGDPWLVAEGGVEGGREPAAAYGCAPADELLAERARAYGESKVGELHVGRWRGSLSGAAASAFPSAELELALRPDHTGTLSFLGARPPAPESATQGYLCDGTVSGGVCGTPSGFVGGYSYELLGIVARGAVISFVVIDADPWRSWCELQAPVERVDLAETCGRGFSPRPVAVQRWSPTGCAEVFDDRSEQPIDCGLMYALERCQCAYDRCFGSFATGVEVGLSLSDAGEELRGSVWFSSNVDAALARLLRQR